MIRGFVSTFRRRRDSSPSSDEARVKFSQFFLSSTTFATKEIEAVIAVHGCNAIPDTSVAIYTMNLCIERSVEPHRSFLSTIPTAPEPRVNASTLDPAAPPWTQQVDKLWRFVVGPTGSVLFSEHPPLLRHYSLYCSLLRLPPSVRPPLFTHIYYSLFFFSFSSDEPVDDP